MSIIVFGIILVGAYFLLKKSWTKINENREYMDSLMGERETKKSSQETQADAIYNFMRREK